MRQILFSAAFCFILFFEDSIQKLLCPDLAEGKVYLRLRGQEVKTSPFHGGNTGSIPVGVISLQFM